MGETKTVTCGRCQHSFEADVAKRVRCPACRFAWFPWAVSETATIAQPAGSGSSAPQGPRLVLINPSGIKTPFSLLKEETHIGRSAENDIVISDPRASRRHATVVRRGSFCFVRDAGSDNGTLVDGQRITEHPLLNGGQFVIGELTFVLELAPHSAMVGDSVTSPGQPMLRQLAASFTGVWRAHANVTQLRRQRQAARQAAQAARQRQSELADQIGTAVMQANATSFHPILSAQLHQLSIDESTIRSRIAELEARRAAEQAALAAASQQAQSTLAQLEAGLSSVDAQFRQEQERLQAVQRTCDQVQQDLAKATKATALTPSPTNPAGDAQALSARLVTITAELEQRRVAAGAVERQVQEAKAKVAAARVTAKAETQRHEQEIRNLAASVAVATNDLSAIGTKRQPLITELGSAAISQTWLDGPIKALVDQARSAAEEETRQQGEAERADREIQLARQAARRSWRPIGTAAAVLLAGVLLVIVTVAMMNHPPSVVVVPPKIDPPRTAVPQVSPAKQVDYERVRQNVGLVLICGVITDPRGQTYEFYSSFGSCFAISRDGYLLTNNHVLKGLEKVPAQVEGAGGTQWPCKARIVVCLGSDRSRRSEASIVYRSGDHDAALIKIGREFPRCYPLAESVSVGQEVYACGFPGTSFGITISLDAEGVQSRLTRIIHRSPPATGLLVV